LEPRIGKNWKIGVGNWCHRKLVSEQQNMVIDRMTGLNRTPAGDAQEDPAFTAVKGQLGCCETGAVGGRDAPLL
jgi:hypothetical protein